MQSRWLQVLCRATTVLGSQWTQSAPRRGSKHASCPRGGIPVRTSKSHKGGASRLVATRQLVMRASNNRPASQFSLPAAAMGPDGRLPRGKLPGSGAIVWECVQGSNVACRRHRIHGRRPYNKTKGPEGPAGSGLKG